MSWLQAACGIVHKYHSKQDQWTEDGSERCCLSTVLDKRYVKVVSDKSGSHFRMLCSESQQDPGLVHGVSHGVCHGLCM